jgi:hypothetical protein
VEKNTSPSPPEVNAGSYWVVSGENIDELSNAVDAFAVFGWKPIGGVSCLLIPKGTEIEHGMALGKYALIQYSQALTHHEWDAFIPDVTYCSE